MLRKSIIVLALGLLLAAPATARQYFDGTMLVSPTSLNLDYMGLTMSIHTEIQCSDVVRSSVVLYGENGMSITPLYITSDLRGNLVAKFTSEDVKKIVAAPSTQLTLNGIFTDGGTFSLHATIRVR